MIWEFPFNGLRPQFIASIRCVSTGKPFFQTFVLDTGACRTCLPAVAAELFGRCDKDKVGSYSVKGLGGTCDGVIHSFRFGLINPEKPPIQSINPPVWESANSEICFMQKLDEVGLIGMDVISQWKELKIVPRQGRSWAKVVISTF